MRLANVLPIVALLAMLCAAIAAETTDPNAGVVTDPTKVEVWTTDKGSKYHSKDCPNAKIKETLAEALIDVDEPCSKCSPPVYDPAKIVVYGSENGKKYHLASCRFAKTVSNLKDAAALGLEPCATCKPPVLWTLPKVAAPTAAPTPAK